MLRIERIASALLIAVTLAACGGGGGGGAPPVNPNIPITNTDPTGTVTGSATKGTIRNAVVTMSQQNSSGTFVPIGTGTVGADGKYSVNYTGYSGGNVLVCVRGKASTDTPPLTTMVCDATDGAACGPTGVTNGSAPGDANGNNIYDLGEELPLDQNFELCTCLPGPPVDGISAPITPFTELVRRRAEERDADAALAEDAQTALLRAASEINQLIGGLDVLRQEPINLADPVAVADADPSEVVYSALLAAVIGRATNDGGTAPLDLQSIIENLAAATDGGRINLADFQELIAEAQEQLLGAGISSDESGVLAGLDAQADACAADSSCTGFNPEPSTNTNAGPISRAKNLVANVRNVINGLNDLEAPGQTFATQVDMAAALLDPPDTINPDGSTTPVLGPVDFLFTGMAEVLGAAAFCVEDNTTVAVDGSGNETTAAATCNGSYTVKGTYPGREAEIAGYLETFANFPATITVSTNGQVTVGIAGTEADNVEANLTAVFPNNAARTTTQTLNASFTGTVFTTASGTGLRLSIPSPATATLTKTGSVPLDDNNELTDDDDKSIDSASFNLPGITLEQTNAPAGQAGGAVSFTGAMGGSIVRCTKQSCMARESQTPTVADPHFGERTFVPSAFNWSGTFRNAANSTAMSVQVSVANAASFDPRLNNESTAPQGSDTLTPTNFPDTTVTLQFDADLGDVEPARVVLTGDLNGIFAQPETNCSSCPAGSTYSDPNATANLQLFRLRGNPILPVQVFRLQANTVDDGNFTGVEATITDSDSASITLDFQGAEQDADGIVRVDGVQVGVVRELSTGLVIVRYDDGTFETLF